MKEHMKCCVYCEREKGVMIPHEFGLKTFWVCLDCENEKTLKRIETEERIRNSFNNTNKQQ